MEKSILYGSIEIIPRMIMNSWFSNNEQVNEALAFLNNITLTLKQKKPSRSSGNMPTTMCYIVF